MGQLTDIQQLAIAIPIILGIWVIFYYGVIKEDDSKQQTEYRENSIDILQEVSKQKNKEIPEEEKEDTTKDIYTIYFIVVGVITIILFSLNVNLLFKSKDNDAYWELQTKYEKVKTKNTELRNSIKNNERAYRIRQEYYNQEKYMKDLTRYQEQRLIDIYGD